MAYYAELDENNIVKRVIVADADFIASGKVGNPNSWVETFMDRSQRKNYAGKGHTYDATRDAFIPPKGKPSFIFDEETATYIPPEPKPKDGLEYDWDETTLKWEKIKL